MEIISMWRSHGMVPPKLVEVMVADVPSGRMTAEAASKGAKCRCGIFNPVRAT